MPVDYQQIFERVRAIGAGMGAKRKDLEQRQAQARDLLTNYAAELDFLRSKVEAAKAVDSSVRCALPVSEALTSAFPPPASLPEATLIAADGSQINPDRHAPLLYCVVNAGAIIMKLSSGQAPAIRTQTELFYGDELQEHRLTSEGAVSLRRDLNERIFVEKLSQGLEGFVINLTDGTIEIWGAKDIEDPGAYERSVQQYLTVLSRLQSRGIPTAGYVDKPSADLVLRLLEIAKALPEDMENIRDYHPLRGVTDLWLFGYKNKDFQLLKPGERSAVFQLQSGSEKFYKGMLSLHFFYLNVSDSGKYPQIARVELPRWVAEDEGILNSLHAVLIQQCRVMGSRPYPYLLHRAHETAVVNHDEKAQIEQLLQQELWKNNGDAGDPSNKSSAKALPGRTRR